MATTHNPALLDALPLPSLKDVVCCYRDPKAGDSRLVRVSELRSYPELLAQGPLGHLMTRGIIDRDAKDRRSDEDRQAEALEWLDALGRADDRICSHDRDDLGGYDRQPERCVATPFRRRGSLGP